MHPSKPPSRARIWTRRQWVHLALSVVGLTVFVACCVAVIRPQLERKVHRHGIGAWVYSRSHPMAFHGTGTSTTIFFNVSAIGERLIVCTPNGIEDLGDPDAHYGVLSELWKPADGRTAWIVSASDDQEPAGLWAPTSKTHTISTFPISVHTIVTLGNGPLPEKAPVEVRAAFWDAVAGEGNLRFPKAVPTLIAYGTWTGSTIVWSGYTTNLATVLGLGAFLWFTPILIRDVVRAWQRKPHMCVACGYDLRGLTTSVCPECGAEIGHRLAEDGESVARADHSPTMSAP